MTAPVIMNMSGTDASMSFVMPSQYQMSDLPTPVSLFLHIQTSIPIEKNEGLCPIQYTILLVTTINLPQIWLIQPPTALRWVFLRNTPKFGT